MWNPKGGADSVRAYEDAGVHRLIVPLQALGPDPEEGMQKISADLIG